MKRGKRYNEALSKVDKTKSYTKEEAVKLVLETANTKFDSTIEVAVIILYNISGLICVLYNNCYAVQRNNW